MENILEIKDLHTYFYKEDSVVKAVKGLNLSVRKGEVLGLVGESGCGKTITAYSVMRLIEPPGKIIKGEIIFKGKDLLKLPLSEMRKIRGGEISLIFQEPKAALNPLYTIGFQMDEMIKIHRKDLTKGERHSLIIEFLKKVGVVQPIEKIKDYPHTLSGGQAQRVIIATMLLCNVSLLIADEPTSNLDVTIQAQVVDLFMQLKQDTKFTLIFITHNLALCSQVADRVAVMHKGGIVEIGPTCEIFKKPSHAYTKMLLSSVL